MFQRLRGKAMRASEFTIPTALISRFDRYQEADVSEYGKAGTGAYDHFFADFWNSMQHEMFVTGRRVRIHHPHRSATTVTIGVFPFERALGSSIVKA